MKRILPAPMGRAFRMVKRSNHVTIVVDRRPVKGSAKSAPAAPAKATKSKAAPAAPKVKAAPKAAKKTS